MAPEQIQHGVAEPRSDLYALGCVLHEMLTGRQLFTGPTDYVVFEKQVKQRPPAVPGVPRELGTLLAQLLEKKPGDRPADADELYRRLEPLAVSLPMLPGFLTRRRVRAGCTPAWSAASSTARSPSPPEIPAYMGALPILKCREIALSVTAIVIAQSLTAPGYGRESGERALSQSPPWHESRRVP